MTPSLASSDLPRDSTARESSSWAAIGLSAPSIFHIMCRAMEWAATGRVFGAAEALEGGLVRSVHEPDELLPAAYALAREIADNTAPVSVALTRQMLWRMLGADHPMVAHRLDSRAVQARGKSDDAKEGVTSFLEKRAAQFPNRVSTDMPDFYPWWPAQPFSPLGPT